MHWLLVAVHLTVISELDKQYSVHFFFEFLHLNTLYILVISLLVAVWKFNACWEAQDGERAE
jgi:hypothetical protein